MSPSRIVQLSTIIADNTRIVDKYFSENGLPTPSVDLNGPPRIAISPANKEVAAAHTTVLDATKELSFLLQGPMGVVMGMSPNDCLSLQAIYRFKVAQAFPVGEERSFDELATATGLNVIDLTRLLRHAMCNFIFREPRAGYVAHTAISKLLAENKLMQDFVGITMEERFPGAAKTVDALEKFGGAYDPCQTGFTLGHDTDKGLYDEMVAHPARNRRFAGAMNAFASMLPLDPLIAGFDWASFGKATLVDVGGAWGPVSIGLAQSFPDLTFIVQDLPEVVAEGPSKVPNELQPRFQFMSYSILEPQPIKDAAIYFFRAVFHNWPDNYCVRILQNQIPALKTGARLIINETCLHEPNTLPATIEKRRRSMDLSMLTFFGSRERTVADWEAIFQKADPRFVLKSATLPPGDMNYIIDVEWTG